MTSIPQFLSRLRLCFISVVLSPLSLSLSPQTSVLCKAAVHAGVISDELGGVISVEERSGQSHYPAVRANQIQSKE